MNTIQTLLTDYLNIWTAADTEKKSGRGRSSGNADRVYGIKKLRELILELAVRGKLVPQDTNDEPASVLLERLAKEKARLITEGKLGKSQPLPDIAAEEIPFKLPAMWEWVINQCIRSPILRLAQGERTYSAFPLVDFERESVVISRNNDVGLSRDARCQNFIIVCITAHFCTPRFSRVYSPHMKTLYCSGYGA